MVTRLPPLHKETGILVILSLTTCLCSGLLLIFSMLDLGSISLFLFPFSGIFGLIYYALAVRRLRSPDPLNLFTSRFALVLPWVMFCADAAGITFVSLAIGWDTIDRLCSRCFFETYDFLPVSGVGNGGTIVTELVLGIIHLGLVVAIFARGLITRRRALAEAERATAQVQAEKKAQMDDV